MDCQFARQEVFGYHPSSGPVLCPTSCSSAQTSQYRRFGAFPGVAGAFPLQPHARFHGTNVPLPISQVQGMMIIYKDHATSPMVESAVTSKGQTTLPKAVREALGVVPGDRVRYVIFDNNEVRMLPVRPHLTPFRGLQARWPSGDAQ